MRDLHRRWYYGIFGVVFFLFWGLFKTGGMPDIPLALLSTAIDVTVTMSVLLVTVEWLLPRMVYTGKIGRFFIAIGLSVLLGGSLIILSQLQLMGRSLATYRQDIARFPKHYFYWFWADLVFGSYFMVTFIPATGAAVRLAFDRMQTLHKLEILQKEKALSELEFLKLQINPHFLFNALNTIYYKIDRSNGPARETLQRFSHLLRYQLYECEQPLIEVEKELGFIRAYIELQRERLNDNYIVDCKGLEEVKGLMISPFLLMPLVENCFKHVSSRLSAANIISFGCSREGRLFRFHTRNSRAADNGEKEKGIGLENVRRRLTLLYPDRHRLLTQPDTDLFEVTLELYADEGITDKN